MIFNALNTVRYSGPSIAQLDEKGRRIYFRACDAIARLWLADAATAAYAAGNFEGAAMLVHAEHYVADRLAYELAPWPKGMVRLETEAPPLPPYRHKTRDPQ